MFCGGVNFSNKLIAIFVNQKCNSQNNIQTFLKFTPVFYSSTRQTDYFLSSFFKSYHVDFIRFKRSHENKWLILGRAKFLHSDELSYSTCFQKSSHIRFFRNAMLNQCGQIFSRNILYFSISNNKEIFVPTIFWMNFRSTWSSLPFV